MKKNHWFARLAGLLFASYCLLVVTVAATGGVPGSESDPLVTLSYLNETFLPQILGRVDEKLAVRDAELTKRLDEQVQADTQLLAERYGVTADLGGNGGGSGDAAVNFTVITLENGDTLYLSLIHI